MTATYVERLRGLAFGDSSSATDADQAPVRHLDAKTLALARMAALIAVGGAERSFGEQADASVSAGASADEIVDLLGAVSVVVGMPRVVDAAPKVALALGHDLDDA